MRIIAGIDAFHSVAGRAVHIALGTFDGLHRGHRAVLDALLAAARPAGEAVVTTFDPHPLAVLAPPPEPFLLSTLAERLDLLAAAGADAVLVLCYDERMRDVAARQWLDLLAHRLNATHVVVASTHTFGHNREGTAAYLQAWGRAAGVDVTIVPLVRAGDRVVSSTGIRDLLRAGDVRTAAAWLGRWYSLAGPVVAGEGRGRSVGIPTANLHVPPEKLIPGTGVYAAFATLRGETYRAAVNVGVRPTFGGGRLSVEAHLLDAEVDAYGDRLDLAFVERLRDEMRFASAADLVAQIRADLKRAAELLVPSPASSGHESS
jgi:riboflavin kinase/FMN adenylyltransferase